MCSCKIISFVHKIIPTPSLSKGHSEEVKPTKNLTAKKILRSSSPQDDGGNTRRLCRSTKVFFRFWFPFLLWLGVIFAFSSNPTTRASEIHWQDFIIKKTAHVVEYFIFSMLLYRALLNSGIRSKRIFAFIVFTAFLYGMSDEFHQSFTPGRDPQPRDVMFDVTGSLLFVYFIKKIVPKNKKLTDLSKMIQLMK